jgi:hypothetical protein
MADDLKLLTLRSLADVGDGDLEKDFEATLAALVKDCLSRPSIKKVRELKVQIQVTPVLNQDGTCDDVEVDVQVGSKAPAKIVPTIRARATVHGGLKWSPSSPDNPDQKTIGFDDK